jgi:hypothetical protein
MGQSPWMIRAIGTFTGRDGAGERGSVNQVAQHGEVHKLGTERLSKRDFDCKETL